MCKNSGKSEAKQQQQQKALYKVLYQRPCLHYKINQWPVSLSQTKGHVNVFVQQGGCGI